MQFEGSCFHTSKGWLLNPLAGIIQTVSQVHESTPFFKMEIEWQPRNALLPDEFQTHINLTNLERYNTSASKRTCPVEILYVCSVVFYCRYCRFNIRSGR